MNMKTLKTALAISLLSTVSAVADAPEKVTIGFLNLVNAQLVTKSLGLVAKEMPGVEIEYIKVGGGPIWFNNSLPATSGPC